MIKRIIILLNVSLVGFISCGNKNEAQSVRTRFEKILNISYTPNQENRCKGWFTDQGSWIGYTIPQDDKWINGFCGPYSLAYEQRLWLAHSAVKVSFKEAKDETFISDSINYLPGEIYLSAHSKNGGIEQSLQFISASTSLLKIVASNKKELFFTGDTWEQGTIFEQDQNTIVAYHPSGRILCLSFAPDVKLTCEENNYQAFCSGDKEVYVVISFFNTDKEKIAGIQKASMVLKNPNEYIQENDKRWDNYLNAILRKDMPEEYNRIAAKSLVTLMSNWQSRKGAILHDGVVPSHAVGYFMGFWAWDSWKHAVALVRFAPELAKNQVRAMFDYQMPDGMVIDCIYSIPEENNERDSKPPLAAWAVDEIFKYTQDTAFLREMYPQLVSYHRWWYTKRDHDKNGVCEFGSTDGTLEAAAWESGMDNAIRFDQAKMLKNAEENAWSFDQESVDLNFYLVMENNLLKKFAGIIGQAFEEPNYTINIVDYFFDNETGFFYDRHLGDGNFVRGEGSEAYIPFWTGLATTEQMDRAINILSDTTKFITYIPFPTVAADNPKFMPKGYWRGPIWLDQTYFAIKGLRNYGYNDLADECTRKVFDRLQGLKEDAPIHENYGTHTGECLKAPHFSWSAASLLLLYEDYGK